jgi:hypothetical protein
VISFKQKGDFKRTKSYLNNAEQASSFKSHKAYSILDHYGQEGVKALQAATPRDTGETASSWSYSITRNNDKTKLSFHNTNIQNGVKIAVILQYGHATKSGVWIDGKDYINPALVPIFEEIASSVWEEVTKV